MNRRMLRRVRMPKFKVIARQVVYEYAYVEAESKEEAQRLTESGEVDPSWNWLDYGSWNIEEVEHG
jgi:hypothetical protein